MESALRGEALRKLMVVASMLAMMLLAASPAMAQGAGSAQYSEQNASGSNINQSSQQCQNSTGDINVAGGDNTAVSQYQYGDTTQENTTEVNVAQQCAQPSQQVNVDGDSGETPETGAMQFNFFGLGSLFG